MDDHARLGGQAVVGGVMIRAGDAWAVAVRKSDGTIAVTRHASPGWTTAARRVPFVRGVVTLAATVALGLRATETARRMDEGEASPASPPLAVAVAVVAVVAVLAVVLVVPALVAGAVTSGSAGKAAVEGGVRVVLILGYLVAISRLPAVAEVFRYHGAEHQAIAAFEAGAPLDAATVGTFSERHPRCGTDFLVLVAAISSVVYGFVGSGGLARVAVSRLALLPAVAGTAYEILRLGGGGSSRWRRAVAWLGLAVQRITTRSASDDHRAVAVTALEAALAGEPQPTASRSRA